MSRTTVEITTDLRDDLKFLKGHLHMGNMTETIRQIMHYAGFSEAFFKYMENKLQDRRMPGDSPD